MRFSKGINLYLSFLKQGTDNYNKLTIYLLYNPYILTVLIQLV